VNTSINLYSKALKLKAVFFSLNPFLAFFSSKLPPTSVCEKTSVSFPSNIRI